MIESSANDARLKSAKTLTMIIYGVYAATFFSGIACIVAIIMNYVKKDDVAGTIYESHFRWQINTFWYSLLWMAIGWITLFIFIGWFILVAEAIWFLYRIIKGFLYLNDGKPMYGVRNSRLNP